MFSYKCMRIGVDFRFGIRKRNLVMTIVVPLHFTLPTRRVIIMMEIMAITTATTTATRIVTETTATRMSMVTTGPTTAMETDTPTGMALVIITIMETMDTGGIRVALNTWWRI